MNSNADFSELKKIRQVKLGPNDLDEVETKTYAGIQMSKVRCASLCLQDLETNPVFCLTVENDCMLVNASIGPYFDNSGGGEPLHDCYTTIKPLFDKGEFGHLFDKSVH